MEDTKPYPLTPAEWKEIMAVRAVREGWGIEDDETVADFSAMVYGVRFNFVSGSPGYVGDLFILQGDALTDAGPMMLRRDDKGALIVV
jgi:hypothetical protein